MICKHFVMIEVYIISHIFIRVLHRWKRLHLFTSKLLFTF